jgi:putative ABC transport system permease protein
LLNRPLSRTGARVPFEGRGLVISDALARRLDLKPGDGVSVEVTEGRRPILTLPVTAVVEDYSGLAAYMDRLELDRLLGDGDTASGSQLLVAPDLRPQFYQAVERAPMIVGASSRAETVAGWRTAMTRAFRVNILFYVSFAGALRQGYPAHVVGHPECDRARDLATLRVLGFDQGECAYILLGEIAVLALAAIPIGLLAGNGLAHGLIALYSRQDLRLPAIISARSYGVSIAVFLAAVALASALTGRRIWTLNLVAVLKTRE